MSLFQLKRGVLLQGFHPWSKQTHGWILSVLGLTLKWKHPESTVWFESSVSIGRRALWSKRYMPVVPKSATGEIFPPQDQIELLRELSRDKLIFSSPSPTKPTRDEYEFWRTFSKWVTAGKPDAPWGDKRGKERAAAALDKLQEEKDQKESPCSSTPQ